MATIKSYTDISQSKTLRKILPIESVDMCFNISQRSNMPPLMAPYSKFNEFFNMEKTPDFLIPCWSLAALLEQLPYELCDDDGNSLYLEINKEDDVYQLVYADRYEDFESIETDRYEHFIDACYELVLKLNELNLL